MIEKTNRSAQEYILHVLVFVRPDVAGGPRRRLSECARLRLRSFSFFRSSAPNGRTVGPTVVRYSVRPSGLDSDPKDHVLRVETK